MLLTAAAERCILSKRAQGIAEGTIKTYRQSVGHLIAHSGDRPIQSYTPHDIDLMANALSDMGNQDSTINRITDNLSAIFKWAIWVGDLKVTRNPVQGRRRRPVRPKERLRIPLESFGPLLAQEGHERDRILIAVGLMMFLRQSELAALRIRDVDMNENVIYVYVKKTNEADRMTIPQELRPFMRSWLTYYSQEVGPLKPDYYLIPAKTRITEGSTLKPDSKMNKIAQIVKAWLERGGFEMDEGEGCHTLRRSGALAYFRALSDRGVDDALRIVMSMLHHKQVSTTEIYLGLKSEAERRNKILDGQPMFPGLNAENVVRIGDADGDRRTAAV